MISPEILAALLIIIILILALDRLGKYVQKVSPQALKYTDYGSCILAIATGGLMYMGYNYPGIRYLFYASIIIYFITLRHTIYTHTDEEN